MKYIFSYLLILFSLNINTQTAGSKIGSGGSSTSPGGNNEEIQFNNSGSFGGAAKAIIKDSVLTILSQNNTGYYSEGIKLTNNLFGLRNYLKATVPYSSFNLQPSFATTQIGYLLFNGDSTTGGPSLRMQNVSFGTIVGQKNIVPGNSGGLKWQIKNRRSYINNSLTSNVVCGTAMTNRTLYRSIDSTNGGFFVAFDFMICDTVFKDSSYIFVGLRDSTTLAPTAAYTSSPVNWTNIIAVGADLLDTSLYILHNDSVGTATKILIGPNFNKINSNINWYNVYFLSPPGSSTVYWRVENETTQEYVEGSINSDLPNLNHIFAPSVIRAQVPPTNRAVCIVHSLIYWETLR